MNYHLYGIIILAVISSINKNSESLFIARKESIACEITENVKRKYSTMTEISCTIRRGQGHINSSTDSFVVDHVVDKSTNSKIFLQEPILLSIDFQQKIVIYDLHFLFMVNGEATEIIVDENLAPSMCGYVNPREPNLTLPFSRGYSCPRCSNAESPTWPSKNNNEAVSNSSWSSIMQLPVQEFPASGRLAPSSTHFYLDQPYVREPINTSPERNGAKVGSFESYVLLDLMPKEIVTQETEKDYGTFFKEEDQISPDNLKRNQFEVNGRQSDPQSPTKLVGCDRMLDGVSGIFINFTTLEEQRHFCEVEILRRGTSCAPTVKHSGVRSTVHCLQMSPLWYGVYKIGASKISNQPVGVKMYKLYGNTWMKMTPPTVEYDRRTPDSLDVNHKLLLVPQPVEGLDVLDFPELSADPGELLLVAADKITSNGAECSKAGSSFEAFFHQTARCLAPAGTCVSRNQPRQLRREDKWAKLRGEPGSYSLDNFVSLPDEPLLAIEDELKLQVRQSSPQELTVSFSLTLPMVGDSGEQGLKTLGRLKTIKVDARGESSPEVHITAINIGSHSQRFIVRVTSCDLEDCARGVIGELYAAAGEVVTFNLCLSCTNISRQESICQMKLFAVGHLEAVASRSFRVQKDSSCLCEEVCRCSCHKDPQPHPCIPLSDEDKLAAGYNTEERTKGWENHYPCFILAAVIAVGTLKHTLMMCGCRSVSMFGFSTMYYHMNQRQMDESVNPVIYGFANVFWLPLSPLLLIHWLVFHCCCCKDSRATADNSEEIIALLEGVKDEADPENNDDKQEYPECNTQVDKDSCECIKCVEAIKIVNKLCEVGFVYRTLNQPIGGALIPKNTSYSVKGYFHDMNDGQYIFTLVDPARQYRTVTQEGEVRPLNTVHALSLAEFTVSYDSPTKVIEEGELSIFDDKCICINTREDPT